MPLNNIAYARFEVFVTFLCVFLCFYKFLRTLRIMGKNISRHVFLYHHLRSTLYASRCTLYVRRPAIDPRFICTLFVLTLPAQQPSFSKKHFTSIIWLNTNWYSINHYFLYIYSSSLFSFSLLFILK